MVYVQLPVAEPTNDTYNSRADIQAYGPSYWGPSPAGYLFSQGLCCESWLAAIVQDEEQLVNVFDCRGLAERDSERLVIKKPQVDAVVLSLLVDDLGIAGLDLEAHSVEEGRVWDIHLQLLCACIGTKQA